MEFVPNSHNCCPITVDVSVQNSLKSLLH
uniref:Uncharacterized protein n=1 Tax=Anguilla anguilla TaxID=7936 RepID=A0A0E9WBI5_ANGAN